MPRAFGGGHEASIHHQRRGNLHFWGHFWPSTCIAKGTTRRGGGCFKPTWYVRRVVYRSPAGVLDASGRRRGGTVRQFCSSGGVIGIFPATFNPSCASPRAQTTGQQLHKTDLVSVQSGPQGIGRYAKCLLPSTMGTGRRSSTRGEVIGHYFDLFGPSDCSSSGRSFVLQKKQTLHFFCSTRFPLKQNVFMTNRKHAVSSFECAIARAF